MAEWKKENTVFYSLDFGLKSSSPVCVAIRCNMQTVVAWGSLKKEPRHSSWVCIYVYIYLKEKAFFHMTTSKRMKNQEEDKKIMPDYVHYVPLTSVSLVGGDVRCQWPLYACTCVSGGRRINALKIIDTWLCKCSQFTHRQRNGELSSGKHKDPIWYDLSLSLSWYTSQSNFIAECLPMAHIKTRDSHTCHLVWTGSKVNCFSTINHSKNCLKVTEIRPGVVQGWSCFLMWSRERTQCMPCFFSD